MPTLKNINSSLTHIEDRYKLAFSVDCVIFGYNEESLSVLLIECDLPGYEGSWSLLGDLVDPNEDLDDSVHRVISKYTASDDLFLEQVATIGDKDRHPLGRVITTAYYTLVKVGSQLGKLSGELSKGKWFPISELPSMAFDHAKIIDLCFAGLQKSVRERPIGFTLLPKAFTMSQLQQFYEVVLGVELDKRNFRRKLAQSGLLEETGDLQSDVSHRPAKLYHFNHELYEKSISSGIHFEI